MTDIIAPPQREKFEAWWETNYHNGNPPRFGWAHWREGDGYQVDDDEPELDGMWEAWKAASLPLEVKDAELTQAAEIAALLSQCLTAANKRIAELERYQTAFTEWHEKTEWVQTDKRFGVIKPWGKHRADVLRLYIEHLESRTVTVKFEPIPVEELGNISDGKKHPYMFGAGYNCAVVHCESVMLKALAAAGIQVIEGDGQ